MGDVHVGSNDVTGHIIHYLHGILGRKIRASGALKYTVESILWQIYIKMTSFKHGKKLRN